MGQYTLIILQYLVPIILVVLPFMLFIDTKPHPKTKINPDITPPRPNLSHLEEKLNNLLNNNHLSTKMSNLNKDLQQTKTHTISDYLNTNARQLKGYHLFQLIFSLIKNKTPDKKIIKLMHHYLPSCSENHLRAILYAYKRFLNLICHDKVQKELIRDLNQNNLRSTLLYLENKLNQTLNKIDTYPPALQSLLIDEAVTYGLIFASFSEFYDHPTTTKVLNLCYKLSPHLFNYWHIFPTHRMSDSRQTSHLKN